ncbi:hypothetical protein N8198_05535 [Gammaproteobacteria bacterium]|nr:hypothetical protein [Gammaproteobacteria bacterium]
MSVDGIWKVEMLGPYGWDAVSTAFLEDGRYLSASQDHYSVGRYQVAGKQIKMDVANHSHRADRAMFGAPGAQVGLTFEGEIKEDQISGQAEDKQAEYSITFRATRLADLP